MSNAVREVAAMAHVALDEVESLRELIIHMWVHSNYTQCGYFQMTTEQKELFQRVTENANK